MSIEFSPLPELRRMSIGSLPLESGESIDDCSISWVEHGLADPDAPVALVLCAIGSTHQRMDFPIRPGLPLDTRRLRILAVNALGNGLSTSASNSARQPGHTFPVFSICDMVASQPAGLGLPIAGLRRARRRQDAGHAGRHSLGPGQYTGPNTHPRAGGPIYTIRSLARNGRPSRFPAVSKPQSTRTGGT